MNSALLLEQRGLDKVESKTLKSVIALYFQYYQQDDPDPTEEVQKVVEPRRSERRDCNTNSHTTSSQSLSIKTSSCLASDSIPGKVQVLNKIKNGVSNGSKIEASGKAETGTGTGVGAGMGGGGGGGDGGEGGRAKMKLNGSTSSIPSLSVKSDAPKRKKTKIIEIEDEPKGDNVRSSLQGEDQEKGRARGRPKLEQTSVHLSNKIDLTGGAKSESGVGVGMGTGKGSGVGRASVGGASEPRSALQNAQAYAALRRVAVNAERDAGLNGTSNSDKNSLPASSSTSSSTSSSSSSESHQSLLEGDNKTTLINNKRTNSRHNAKLKLKEESELRRLLLKKTKADQQKNVPRNYFNLYWIKNSRLPCIYYDKLGGEERDRFNVLPICCTTYHYTVQVSTAPAYKYKCTSNCLFSHDSDIN